MLPPRRPGPRAGGANARSWRSLRGKRGFLGSWSASLGHWRVSWRVLGVLGVPDPLSWRVCLRASETDCASGDGRSVDYQDHCTVVLVIGVPPKPISKKSLYSYDENTKAYHAHTKAYDIDTYTIPAPPFFPVLPLCPPCPPQPLPVPYQFPPGPPLRPAVLSERGRTGGETVGQAGRRGGPGGNW